MMTAAVVMVKVVVDRVMTLVMMAMVIEHLASSSARSSFIGSASRDAADAWLN